MSESEKSFTVSDRRHFTPDGRPRDEGDREEPGSVPPARSEREPAIAEPTGGSEPPRPAQAPPRRDDSEPAARDAPGETADFSQFLLSLGAQAGMLLTGEGLPEDMDASQRLAGARSLIAILEMLKEKTEGRRTSREDEVLEGLLFELRMAYVEASRTSGS
jgi:hypothetical protein